MTKTIAGIAGICNAIGFISMSGYGLGLWNDPHFNARLLGAAFFNAAVSQLEAAFG